MWAVAPPEEENAVKWMRGQLQGLDCFIRKQTGVWSGGQGRKRHSKNVWLNSVTEIYNLTPTRQ